MDENPDHDHWRTVCVKTCGYCDDPEYNPNAPTPAPPTPVPPPPAPPQACEDKISDCDVHTADGGCKDASPYQDYWRTNCVKTCGYCNDPEYNSPEGCAGC